MVYNLAKTGAQIDAIHTKVDNIESNADVTDEANVKSALDGASLTAVTVAADDKVMILDTSDTDNLKSVTAQSIADLASGSVSQLSDLSDVTITTLGADELLFTQDGSTFINQTLAEAGISAVGHTHTASEVTDFDTEVSNNTDVAANTTARHSAITVTDSAEIDFTLTGQNITASIVAGSIDETKLDASTNASLDLADSASQPGHTHTATNITDFDTEVSNNSSVTANTAKVTNATHTGDVTGATTLTVDKTAITGKTVVTALGTDYVLISDTSDTGNLKKALISDFASAGGDMSSATYDPASISEQLVGLTATQTLTNKTINTSSNTITVNSADVSDLPSATVTFTNKTIDANGTGNSITNLEVADFTAASVVTEAEGLASSDNDTSLPTTAAVKDAIDKRSETLILAASDETTALTTGTGKVTFRMPFAMTLTSVRASLTTAGTTSGTTTIDINESGTTILSTKLTIDFGEKTSTTAATAPVISDSALADDAEITVDVDAITGGATEAGLKIYLIGTRA